MSSPACRTSGRSPKAWWHLKTFNVSSPRPGWNESKTASFTSHSTDIHQLPLINVKDVSANKIAYEISVLSSTQPKVFPLKDWLFVSACLSCETTSCRNINLLHYLWKMYPLCSWICNCTTPASCALCKFLSPTFDACGFETKIVHISNCSLSASLAWQRSPLVIAALTSNHWAKQ